MAVLYKTNGATVVVEPQNGKYFTLEELQKFVDGHIELVYLPKEQIMVVNEEGKINCLTINIPASELLQKHGIRDLIAGDAVVIEQSQIR